MTSHNPYASQRSRSNNSNINRQYNANSAPSSNGNTNNNGFSQTRNPYSQRQRQAPYQSRPQQPPQQQQQQRQHNAPPALLSQSQQQQPRNQPQYQRQQHQPQNVSQQRNFQQQRPPQHSNNPTQHQQHQHQQQRMQPPPQQQPPPQNPPPTNNNNTTAVLQQELDKLRQQLMVKEEENFELSASLMSVQVETKHQIEQVEQNRQQQIKKLQEDLRRTQQDANRARAALKKQQQQQQHQTVAPLQPQPQNPQQSSVAATRPFNNSSVPQGPKVVVPACTSTATNGGIGPSPRSRPEPMEVDPPCSSTRDNKGNPQDAAPLLLAHRLLQELPIGEDDRIRAVLTRIGPRESDDDILWTLVQESIDGGANNPTQQPALRLLHKTLLWSPNGCQAILRAAGWETENNNDRTSPLSYNPTRTPTIGGIRLESSQQSNQQKLRLEAIANRLKRPLTTMLPKQQQPTRPTNQSSFSPKQERLARQLLAGLVEAIPNDTTVDFPHKESMGLLIRLLSSIRSCPPRMAALEPMLLKIESFLKAQRPENGDVRGYDPIQPRFTTVPQSTPSTAAAAAAQQDATLVVELCRQLARLLPVNSNDDDPAQQVLHQWRKAVLANACDWLEGRLLPLLLLNKAKTKQLPPAYKEWIPWMQTLVEDEAGRQLLRTQFPRVVVQKQGEYNSTGMSADSNHSHKNYGNNKRREISCSAMGVVLQLLYASVMVEQQQSSHQRPRACRILRDQCVRCLHAWLQCYPARQGGDISFLDLVSEYSDYYKCACAWILHLHDSEDDASSHDIAAMVRLQLGELCLDEEDALAEREEKYGSLNDGDED